MKIFTYGYQIRVKNQKKIKKIFFTYKIYIWADEWNKYPKKLQFAAYGQFFLFSWVPVAPIDPLGQKIWTKSSKWFHEPCKFSTYARSKNLKLA